MNTKPVKVPQAILDTCPLPDGYSFVGEEQQRWAGLRQEDEGRIWIGRGDMMYLVENGGEKSLTAFPPETTHEELWRYVYAQFILGDDND